MMTDEFPYFLTLTVIDWVDVFSRPKYKHIIVDSLNFCIEKKGLIIYSWCLMTNHLHLIARAIEETNLSDILRDFKKFTSKEIVEAIQNAEESRRSWMLNRFEFAGRYNKKIKNYKFWQDSNKPKEILTGAFLQQKLDYIHQNPVVAEIVQEPEEYIYSSARDYSNMPGLVKVVLA